MSIFLWNRNCIKGFAQYLSVSCSRQVKSRLWARPMRILGSIPPSFKTQMQIRCAISVLRPWICEKLFFRSASLSATVRIFFHAWHLATLGVMVLRIDSMPIRQFQSSTCVWTSTTLRISVSYVVSRFLLVSTLVDCSPLWTMDWYGLRRNFDIDVVGFLEFKPGTEKNCELHLTCLAEYPSLTQRNSKWVL